MVRAVIFDFDGVLVDSERLHYEGLAHVLNSMGLSLSWEEFKEGCIGVPDLDAIKWALMRNGIEDEKIVEEVLRRKTEVYDSWLSERLTITDGVANVLMALSQKFHLAIASGAFRHQIDLALSKKGIKELFQVIVGREDYEIGKPDPTPFLMAMEKLNELASPPLRPHECLVVEDSPAGVEAARKAGMLCVAVRTYFSDDALKDADIILDDLKALLQPKVWEHFQTEPLL